MGKDNRERHTENSNTKEKKRKTDQKCVCVCYSIWQESPNDIDISERGSRIVNKPPGERAGRVQSSTAHDWLIAVQQ